MEKSEQIAELQYSPEYGRIELILPYGSKLAQLSKVRESLFTEIVSRLPRGCPACTSGESLIIRERLEHVLRVNLRSMEIVEEV